MNPPRHLGLSRRRLDGRGRSAVDGGRPSWLSGCLPRPGRRRGGLELWSKLLRRAPPGARPTAAGSAPRWSTLGHRRKLCADSPRRVWRPHGLPGERQPLANGKHTPRYVKALLAYCDTYGAAIGDDLTETSLLEPPDAGDASRPEHERPAGLDMSSGQPEMSLMQAELVSAVTQRLRTGPPMSAEDRATYRDQLEDSRPDYALRRTLDPYGRTCLERGSRTIKRSRDYSQPRRRQSVADRSTVEIGDRSMVAHSACLPLAAIRAVAIIAATLAIGGFWSASLRERHPLNLQIR